MASSTFTFPTFSASAAPVVSNTIATFTPTSTSTPTSTFTSASSSTSTSATHVPSGSTSQTTSPNTYSHAHPDSTSDLNSEIRTGSDTTTTTTTATATVPVSESPSPSPSPPKTLGTSAQSAQPAQSQSRAALDATLSALGTHATSPLYARANTIHQNSLALDAQETALLKDTHSLSRTAAQWEHVAANAQNVIKSIGDVQNWAEMLERDLLVVGCAMDMVERDGQGAGK